MFHVGALLTRPSLPVTTPLRWVGRHERSTKHVKVVIIGLRKVVLHRDFHVKLSSGWAETATEMFLKHGALTKPIPPLAIADVDFGMELEMSTPPNLSINNTVNFICSGSRRIH